jgi:hypothetical protein
MTESKLTSSTPSPDPLDPLLAEWSSQFKCSPDQVATMWNRVSDSLASDRHIEGESERPANSPVPSRTGLMHFVGKLSLAACLLLALGLGISKLREGQQGARPQALSSSESLARFAFTPEELHEKEVLSSEIQQLCLKPVLVRRTSIGWDIDEVPSLNNAAPSGKTAMVIRCLLMESTSPVSSPNDSWRVVDQEEVITGAEYQHFASNDQHGDVEAWVHLLPDQSLWTECHDESREEVCVLKQNEPSIVWEESNDSGTRRFVVVYQCLDIEDV